MRAFLDRCLFALWIVAWGLTVLAGLALGNIMQAQSELTKGWSLGAQGLLERSLDQFEWAAGLALLLFFALWLVTGASPIKRPRYDDGHP